MTHCSASYKARVLHILFIKGALERENQARFEEFYDMKIDRSCRNYCSIFGNILSAAERIHFSMRFRKGVLAIKEN